MIHGGQELVFLKNQTRDLVRFMCEQSPATSDDMLAQIRKQTSSVTCVDLMRLPQVHKLMSWSDLRALRDTGQARFAAHSLLHHRVTSLTSEEFNNDAGQCKRAIEFELDVECEDFVYPFGSEKDHSDTTEAVLEGIGFRRTYTTRSEIESEDGIQTPRQTTRRRVWPGLLALLSAFVAAVACCGLSRTHRTGDAEGAPMSGRRRGGPAAMPKVLFCRPRPPFEEASKPSFTTSAGSYRNVGWTPVLGLASGGRFNDAARYEALNPGLPVHRIVPRYQVRRARVAAVIDAVRTVEPDVVVCARIADAYEAVARLKLVKSRPRLAVAVRGLGAQEMHDLSCFQHFMDACIVDGRLVAEACVAIGGIERERVFSVPGGVHAPVGPVTPRVPRRELNVGYVGRIADADKRVLDLIELVKLLEQADLPYKLSIVGDGPDLPALKAALATPERAARIAFLRLA